MKYRLKFWLILRYDTAIWINQISHQCTVPSIRYQLCVGVMGLCFTMEKSPFLSTYKYLLYIDIHIAIVTIDFFSFKHSNLRTANSEILAHNLSYCINFHTPYKLCFVSYFHKHLMWHLSIIQCISGIHIVLFNILLFIKTFFQFQLSSSCQE